MPKVTLLFQKSNGTFKETFSFQTEQLRLPPQIQFEKKAIVEEKKASLPAGLSTFKVALADEMLQSNALALGDHLRRGYVVQGRDGLHITSVEKENSTAVMTIQVEPGLIRNATHQTPESFQQGSSSLLPSKRPREEGDERVDRPPAGRPPPPPPPPPSGRGGGGDGGPGGVRGSGGGPPSGGGEAKVGRLGRPEHDIVTNFVAIRRKGPVSFFASHRPAILASPCSMLELTLPPRATPRSFRCSVASPLVRRPLWRI
eukprot:scaffold183620_cov26-Tisochrysis_lutea.AAC.2